MIRSLALLLPLLAVPAAAPDDDPIERLEAWPELTDEARTEKDVARLRAANTEAMGTEAHAALVADGASAAPLLLKSLGKERGEDARARIVAVLDLIVGAPHTRLLAEWFDDRALQTRIWTRRTAARYPDPGLASAAATAWKAIEKKKDKADPEERWVTSLLLTSTGDISQLEDLLTRAGEDWKKSGTLLREVFAGLRGTAAPAALGASLEGAARKQASPALRLLAACGSETELRHVAPFLDSNDNTLRVDAINACRAIVDGEAPLDRLSVFEAIEMAKQWKERL